MLCWAPSLKRELVRQTKGEIYCPAVPVGDLVYHFGGFHHGTTSNMDQVEVHIFDTVSMLWMELPPVMTGRRKRPLEVPCLRWGHTAVLLGDIIYIWGGIVNCKITEDDTKWICVNGDYGDNLLYAFDVDTHKWFKPKMSGTVPEGREDHSACVSRKVMYIHGGHIKSGKTNDIYQLDITTMLWSLIDTRGIPPPVSYRHSATIIGTKMFVFGGACLNSLRVFDTETNLWLATHSAQLLPEGRSHHVAFAYNGELYIYGGFNNLLKQNFSDLWKCDPKTFTWKKVEHKGEGQDWGRTRFSSKVGDQILIFGYTTHTTTSRYLQILHLSPSLKTLCKLAVIQYGLEQSGLPHNIRWELAAMATTK